MNPATAMGQMGASAPPAMATSTSPRRSISNAMPIASAPDEHAVTVHRFGPCAPKMMLTCPGPMSASIIGTRNGLTRLGPRSASTPHCSDSVMMPPMPEPMTAAARVGSTAPPRRSRFACSSACAVAPTANCAKRSSRRACFRST